MDKNRWIGIIISLFLIQGLTAQSVTNLTLEAAYQLLEERYPTLRNGNLLNEIHQKELVQLDKTKLPSLTLNSNLQVQTGSTQLDAGDNIDLPFEINQPLYSARTYVEGQYMIKDGGRLEAEKALKAVELEAEQQDIEVERFALRKRVNTLVVNIQLLQEQVGVFDISLKDLATRQEQVAANVENGTLLPSELTKLNVKELELKAQQSDVNYRLRGLKNSLADLLGVTLSDDFEMTLPKMANPTSIPPLNRPEQKLFQLQRAAIMANSTLIDASNRPQLSAFAQAGVGYPNPLNLLDNGAAPYGLVGLKFSWKFVDWKKSSIDKELLSLQSMKLQNVEDAFTFNMNTQKANYLSEINRLQAQIKLDQEIAALQTNILAELSVQLEEGIITSADYVTQLNSELLARQNILIHQTELVKTQLEYWNERGGF